MFFFFFFKNNEDEQDEQLASKSEYQEREYESEYQEYGDLACSKRTFR